ncbi:hypothetical protein [Vagococcus silagei]|uniref:hypothetical protein n=1 Tax=Vagococcus silagei TaxID=2508885 RepID=UPI00109D52D2|nr:hypothetical protein [Vagococcus silagei]
MGGGVNFSFDNDYATNGTKSLVNGPGTRKFEIDGFSEVKLINTNTVAQHTYGSFANNVADFA